LDLKSNRF